MQKLQTTQNAFAPLLPCRCKTRRWRLLLFSADWPFEDVSDATEWFEGIQLSYENKQKISRENTLRLMKIIP